MKHQTDTCGCCEGIEKLTPQPTDNRPGLDALSYRVGTHAKFFETMLARLSNLCLGTGKECDEGKGSRPLQDLKTRERDDPSIALLDAWATVADVLTFYQERIANEGFLRTATERRSLLELARLVGYKLRPGVSSSVFLAYTLDENFKDEVVIPKGARAQSVPGPGELPQSFETSEELTALAMWNNLRPRMTRPQTKDSILLGDRTNQHVYLKGISTNLKPNDPLLIDFSGNGQPEFYRVKAVAPDPATNRTLVTFQEEASEAPTPTPSPAIDLIGALTLRPSVQLANSSKLERNLNTLFPREKIEHDTPGLSLAGTAENVPPRALLRKTLAAGEASHTTLKTFAPELRKTLATAAENAQVTVQNPIKGYALRMEASLFGHNVPKRTSIQKDGSIAIAGDWPIIEEVVDHSTLAHVEPRRISHEEENAIYLDNRYDNILRDSWIVIKTPETARLTEKKWIITKVNNIDVSVTRSEYGMTAPSTRIELGEQKWIELLENPSDPTSLKPPSLKKYDDFNAVRATTVYLQSEELKLAEEPVEELVYHGADDQIELDGFYEGLESGRWLIVSGERDIPGTSGVRFSEVAMVASVEHKYNENLPGDRTHTYIKLAENLEYCFKRDTVIIYGNVVKATHGETRKEVLGSGDGSKALQSFALKQPPLTFVSAPNPSGVDSTLRVYVNDVQWHEAESLVKFSPTSRSFITKTDDEGKTVVICGNGREGARLPTGTENIRAEYRNGIGKSGNVKAGQISLLMTRPLGVREVINPLRASGGADRESRDQARKNAPLAVTALDRLVSVQDYEDFARTYAGIGKARAMEISDGKRQVVHVTIASAENIPIDESSDLFLNLCRALHDFGDPYQPVMLSIRELMLIVISAGVRIMPDYQWEPVVTQVRSALLDAFGFERRELGQDVLLSEVISVMQGVRGVAYVDVDAFGGIPEKIIENSERRLLTPDEISESVDCLSTQWTQGNMEAWCAERSEDKECNKYIKCKKYGNVEKMKGVRQRLRVNLTEFEGDSIRPAQLAFLTPDVPATLIVNQIP
jgi:hypothetical protein